MSERILKALMQLFAIVADVDDLSNKSRAIVELFLKQQLSLEMVPEYLKLYDDYLEAHHKVSLKKEGKKKRTSLNSVKVLKICTQINAELTQKQKIVVLIRILEYLHSEKGLSEQEMEFVTTVADTFNISKEEFDNCKSFIEAQEERIPNSSKILIINNKKEHPFDSLTKHIYAETLEGVLTVLDVESVNMYLLRYFGTTELYINGQLLNITSANILTQGSSIRSSKVKPIYYSDIISRFMSDKSQQKIVFTAQDLEFRFKTGKLGLHPLTFEEESNNMIGIMGGSGAGKSTLLNVLNGNAAPSSGQLLINGFDVYKERDKIEGLIGYVPQDDLLIEELSVFQNLFYNTKLCFDGLDDDTITKMVMKTLKDLGLEETRDLKVGNVMMKTISGGQRKRLNIGLELIREPAILFADEPTSGLSSRDSENIMDLLKELSLKGKLVFVVIHQPSSEIFKMFDKLLILDVGGFPIYYGNPVDGVIYFKHRINHVNADESECKLCGNVNPEQIFNIIESKVLDEYGNLTDNRKVSPKEWNEFYKEKLENKTVKASKTTVPKIEFQIPNPLKQFKVFITRDVLSKLTNTQYLAINLLEAPLLAFVLGFFVKFYNPDVTDIKTKGSYVFYYSENLVAYMFMAVVVALFLGMTVSAEEIIRDQKIRKRESFLNLSKGSYLGSKIIIMFVLSAIQMVTFVLVGNTILGIKGMYFDYWLILFSAACFANMLGLNISATFNSAVTIYIIIPFLLVPQLLFSGLIVKFEKLNPMITSQTEVPVLSGDIWTSRWAFEALAVNQFKNNKSEKLFYLYNRDEKSANWKKNFWRAKIDEKIGLVQDNLGKPDKKDQIAAALRLLRNEFTKEMRHLPKNDKKFQFEQYASLIDNLTPEKVNNEILENAKTFVQNINKFYIRVANSASERRDDLIATLSKTPEEKAALTKLKNDYENISLSDLVTNKNDLNFIIEIDNMLIQRQDPVYLDPETFRAHFYAPRKKLFGSYIETFWANISVIWLMAITLMITLYFDFFKKILEGLEKLTSKLMTKKK